MDTFLPADYTVPSSDRYFKFKPGNNQFRILDSPILGNEYWGFNDKPVRKRTGEKITISDIRSNKDGTPGTVKHFWAMPIWDGQTVKILEITQKKIQTSITDLVNDEDWGNPREYDIVINRDGEGLNTEYSVKAKPRKPLPAEAKEAWEAVKENGFDLNALYQGDDPFNPTLTTRDVVDVFMDATEPEFLEEEGE